MLTSRQSQQDLENTREAIYQQVAIMQDENYKNIHLLMKQYRYFHTFKQGSKTQI